MTTISKQITVSKIVARVSSKTRYSEEIVGKVLNEILVTMSESVLKEEKINLTPFGSFVWVNKGAGKLISNDRVLRYKTNMTLKFVLSKSLQQLLHKENIRKGNITIE